MYHRMETNANQIKLQVTKSTKPVSKCIEMVEENNKIYIEIYIEPYSPNWLDILHLDSASRQEESWIWMIFL